MVLHIRPVRFCQFCEHALQLDWLSVRHLGQASVMLSVSNLKSDSSFAFLIKNYTREGVLLFCKTSKWAWLASFCVLVFSRGFYVKSSIIEINIDFFTEKSYCGRSECV